jgi:hypothetical protein
VPRRLLPSIGSRIRERFRYPRQRERQSDASPAH